MAVNIEQEKKNLLEGRGVSAGVCWNPDRNPEFFECSEEEQAVARGEKSVSWDGRIVTDLVTGESETRDQPDEFKVVTPVTLAEATEAAGGETTGTAGADTQTTDSTGGGTSRRSGRATG